MHRFRGLGRAADGAVQAEAMVVDALPDAVFRVELENGHQVLAHLSTELGKRVAVIRPGDRVRVELYPHDLSRGRIVARLS